jgi:hypothetical protein
VEWKSLCLDSKRRPEAQSLGESQDWIRAQEFVDGIYNVSYLLTTLHRRSAELSLAQSFLRDSLGLVDFSRVAL